MLKRKNENELEEHEKPSTKRQRFKSGPANQKFLPLYHELWPCNVWSDQTRVTHLQNVLCVIRTSVVLILDDMIDKWIYNINDHASPGHDFITSKSV